MSYSTHKNISKLFLQNMTLVILCAIPLVGAYWIFNEYLRFEDGVVEMKARYIAEQKRLIKTEVDQVMAIIDYHNSQRESLLRKKLQSRVRGIHRVITEVYERHKDSVTKERLQKMIKDVIRSSVYNKGRGYYFALSLDSDVVVQPGFESYEGKSADNGDELYYKAAKGIVDVASELGEGSHKYSWKRFGDKKYQDKLSYVQVFEPYGWIIGTGEYLDDFDRESRKLLVKQIDTIRFGKNGYIYIFRYDGVCLSHYKESYVGQNRWDYTDSRGFKLIQAIIGAAKDNSEGSYLEYIGSIKPETQLPSRKLGYIRGVPDWKWAVGSGVYLDDLELEVAAMRRDLIDEVKLQVVVTCLALLFFMLISYGVAKRLAANVQRDFDRFSAFFHDALDNTVNLEPNKFTLCEFEMLALAANRMIEHKRNIEETLRHNQKMDTIGKLAGGIAHDFNNALGGVKGSVSLLKLLLKKDNVDLDQVSSVVDLVDGASNSAASIVNQLLTLSQKHELELAPVDMNDVVRRTIQLCRSSFDKKIDIVVKYLPTRAVVDADAMQLEQVFLNMCINASHAMTVMRDDRDSYGGTLTVEVDEFVPEDELQENDGAVPGQEYYVCRIKDTGVGIDKKILDKIFDPFFTTKDKADGTGLGLSMVYRIVQLHGGVCNVFSKVGYGSTFNIFIPKSNSKNRKIVGGSDDVIKGQGRILVIDDDSHMRSAVNNILTECGYDVILASDGVLGIEEYRNRGDEIDLVLLDMSMPNLSGKETFVKLKEIDPDVKVLMSSGFGQDERVEDCFELGIYGFIQKPFTAENLSQKIDDVLS